MRPAVAKRVAANIRAMSPARRLQWLAARLQIWHWKRTMMEDNHAR